MSDIIKMGGVLKCKDTEGQVYALFPDGGMTISQAAFDALPDDEKNKGLYYIPDGDGGPSGGASSAGELTYDNSESGLEAENVQDAIDELNQSLNNMSPKLIATAASGQTYASQCAVLYEAYQNLTTEQRLRSFVLYGSVIFHLSNAGNGLFCYAMATGDKVSVQSILLYNLMLIISNITTSGTTISNVSTDKAQADMSLYTYY